MEDKKTVICSQCGNKITDPATLRCPRCNNILVHLSCEGNCSKCGEKCQCPGEVD